jgi:8-amino-7-oxononanoate synthase
MTMPPPPRSAAEELRQLEAAGLRRNLRPLDGPGGPQVVRDGRTLWNFAANDYLGLAAHPALAGAFVEGLRRYGAGAGASRLVTGSLPPHHEFEAALAAAKEAEAALLFSSGFATALGTLAALAGKGDAILLDKLCHACLIDGARLSGATLRVFPHNDLDKLARLLCSVRSRSPASARVIVVTESVFSMDGDTCPLPEIVELKDRHGALLLLDEAHAFGVLGPRGLGLADLHGLQGRGDLQMGTLSKAAGLAGGYLAARRDLVDVLVNRARSFIYSTAPPPALACAALASLELIRSAEGAARRRLLHRHAGFLRQARGLSAADPPTPIHPCILGGNDAAIDAACGLERAGFLVPAIRFPTVPRGTARLRVSLSASHPPEAVRTLADALPRLT